jgi:hypothetical protein
MSEEIFTGKIDTDQALALLERAVATQGEDFVYTPYPLAGCYYRPLSEDESDTTMGPDPRTLSGCLIGVALRFAGIDLSDVNESIGMAWRLGNGPVGWKYRLTPGGLETLQAAQRAQDGGKTWGESLAIACAKAGYPPL